MAPIVNLLILILYPIAYPLSRYLDWQFGVHSDKKRFNRKDLKTLIELHRNNSGIFKIFFKFRLKFN